MKLPTKVRYAVRAVVELAQREATSPVPVKVLSEAQGISSKYGKQIMNRLQRAGIVKGRPGVHGGYTLAREPECVSILDIYRAMDGRIELVPCLETGVGCTRLKRCSVRRFWNDLNHVLENQLRSATIDQLAMHERSRREGDRA